MKKKLDSMISACFVFTRFATRVVLARYYVIPIDPRS